MKRFFEVNIFCTCSLFALFPKFAVRRPPYSLFVPCDSSFVSQKFSHQPRWPLTKTRTSETTLGTGTGVSKIQDDEDVDVLGSPALYLDLILQTNILKQGETQLPISWFGSLARSVGFPCATLIWNWTLIKYFNFQPSFFIWTWTFFNEKYLGMIRYYVTVNVTV